MCIYFILVCIGFIHVNKGNCYHKSRLVCNGVLIFKETSCLTADTPLSVLAHRWKNIYDYRSCNSFCNHFFAISPFPSCPSCLQILLQPCTLLVLNLLQWCALQDFCIQQNLLSRLANNQVPLHSKISFSTVAQEYSKLMLNTWVLTRVRATW